MCDHPIHIQRRWTWTVVGEIKSLRLRVGFLVAKTKSHLSLFLHAEKSYFHISYFLDPTCFDQFIFALDIWEDCEDKMRDAFWKTRKILWQVERGVVKVIYWKPMRIVLVCTLQFIQGKFNFLQQIQLSVIITAHT